MVKEGGVYEQQKSQDKAMAMAVAAAMAVELCPVTAFAVTGD